MKNNQDVAQATKAGNPRICWHRKCYPPRCIDSPRLLYGTEKNLLSDG